VWRAVCISRGGVRYRSPAYETGFRLYSGDCMRQCTLADIAGDDDRVQILKPDTALLAPVAELLDRTAIRQLAFGFPMFAVKNSPNRNEACSSMAEMISGTPADPSRSTSWCFLVAISPLMLLLGVLRSMHHNVLYETFLVRVSRDVQCQFQNYLRESFSPTSAYRLAAARSLRSSSAVRRGP
jgi:hypothetical protein